MAPSPTRWQLMSRAATSPSHWTTGRTGAMAEACWPPMRQAPVEAPHPPPLGQRHHQRPCSAPSQSRRAAMPSPPSPPSACTRAPATLPTSPLPLTGRCKWRCRTAGLHSIWPVVMPSGVLRNTWQLAWCRSRSRPSKGPPPTSRVKTCRMVSNRQMGRRGRGSHRPSMQPPRTLGSRGTAQPRMLSTATRTSCRSRCPSSCRRR
mmetsp:Transcript_11025/g.33043  ORF Transcript_11025/g.33043 Transcript_11025/m.33043 type:complete len:205 (+) Transcript_11025:6128-6742(+)